MPFFSPPPFAPGRRRATAEQKRICWEIAVTIEKVVSPQRREINRVGAPPDEEVAPTGTGDPVLTRALAWLATQLR